jgi:hypothetical protein
VDFWRENSEKNGFFEGENVLQNLDFSTEKRQEKNPTPSKESDFLFCWCRLTESNRQPTDYDSVALPIELRRQPN